ncbi:hypothetical protein O181_085948, partial [Austropuccinia psidii MF-1]|nr:hypothetical protein [Austropuccinia psidii MF-1]
SSIRDSSSDSEASESSIEIQTSPAPRGLITKEPFKGPAEVEVITPSNQMDLDQDIPVTNQKGKNFSPEERHKWRIPELPPVPKVSVQELVYGRKTERVGTSLKCLDRHNELLSSSEEVHGSRKDRRTSEGFDTKVLQRPRPTDKSLVEKPNILSEDQKKKLAQGKENSPLEAPQASTSKNPPQQVPSKPKQPPKTNQKGKQKAKGKANPNYLNCPVACLLLTVCPEFLVVFPLGTPVEIPPLVLVLTLIVL